jgi:hypothetical protein
MISEAPECGQARTSSRGIVTKSAPPPTNRVCLYCGLQSAATSHGSVADCVDALQREVARLRDHLHQGKPSGPVIFSTCIGSGQCRSDGDSAPSRWLIPRTWCCGGATLGPLSRSAAVGVLSYAQRGLFAYRLSSDEMISRNKSPRLGRLSVLLRTSLPRHSGYAGGQVFIKHASGPGAHPVD